MEIKTSNSCSAGGGKTICVKGERERNAHADDDGTGTEKIEMIMQKLFSF